MTDSSQLDKPDSKKLLSQRLREAAQRHAFDEERELLYQAAEALERFLLNRLNDELASSSLAREDFDESWLLPHRIVPVDMNTTSALLAEVRRLRSHAPSVGARTVECPECNIRFRADWKEKSAASPAATAMPDSPTPRTDDAKFKAGDTDADLEVVTAEFAGQLERGLADMTQARDAIRLLAQGWKEDAERAALSSAITQQEGPRAMVMSADGLRVLGNEPVSPPTPPAMPRGESVPCYGGKFENRPYGGEGDEIAVCSICNQAAGAHRSIVAIRPTTAMPNDDRRVHLACEIANRIGMMIPYEGTKMQKVDHAGWKKLQAVATELVKLLLAEHPSASSARAMPDSVPMSRDLVLAIRTYVQAKADKQAAMGLDSGATGLLLNQIDRALDMDKANG